MRTRPAYLVAASLLACGTVWAQGVTGKWTGNMSPYDDGMPITVALNQSADGKITGYVLGRSDDRITSGKIEGDKIIFDAERAGRGGTQQVTYTGTLEGDKIKLTLPMGGRGGAGRGSGGPGRGPAGTDAGRGRGGDPGRGAGPGFGPGGGRGPQVIELSRASTAAPGELPARPGPVSLPAPEPVKRNNLAKTPPMGWNSWNKFRNQVTDKMIREMADALVTSGMRDAGYIYLNIDDTWEKEHDANGSIVTNNKFPNMKALADYVHSKGLKLGIYSSPGPKTCGGYEGSYRYEEKDAMAYASWGIDYLKYDWCSASQVYDGSKETMMAAYAKMGTALAKSGRAIVFSLCQYGEHEVGAWGERVGGNLWRTTGDIQDRWASMERIGFDEQPGREKFAGVGHWNDPDMLEIGNGGMSDTEYRTHMSLWCLLAAPLLAGNDIREMKPEIAQILMNKEVIAVNQDRLGKQGVRVAQDGKLEVWSKPLADGGYAVGLFNRGDAPAKVTAKWSAVGASGSHAVRDLWAHADLGKMKDEFVAEVPSHGVVMVKIAK